MNALINSTNKASSNLPNNSNKGIIALLKQKVEDCMMECKPIVISISTPLTKCLNTVKVDDCEISEESLCLNDGNFEIHIDFTEDTHITHEEVVDKYFSIIMNNMEVNLYFV